MVAVGQADPAEVVPQVDRKEVLPQAAADLVADPAGLADSGLRQNR